MPDDTVLLERHFNTAFAAPNGIQKLRELILTLAMQGKLVPQDPKDQPASELLKAIEAEKQRLLKEGKIKQPKLLSEIEIMEMPYQLPKDWKWAKLGDVMFEAMTGIDRGKQFQSKSNEYPYFKMNNISNSGCCDFSNVTRINYEGSDHEKYVLREGDFLFNTRNSRELVGKTCIFKRPNNEQWFFNNNILRIDLPDLILNHFVNFWFLSPLGKSELEKLKSATTNVAAVYQGKLVSFPIPLPPLAEQRRIVAKIDRLMARCDELEKLRVERNQKRITIHTAALNRLLNAKESNDFSTAWRFITQHFGELYSVKENVAELRKAILQLAVMGKLVPQDPTDEPASELLRAIAAEKQQLVKEGQIKQPKSLPKIKMEDMPYTLPKVWEWIRLGTVVISSHAGRSPQCLPGRRTGNEWGVLKVSAVSWGTFDPNENKALPPGMQPRLEDEVKVGDFLLSRANTEELVARSVVVKHTPPNLMISDKTVRLIISDQVDKQFINTAHLSNHARTYYASNASGTSSSMKNVSREIMYQLPIPLPPLAEQRRIVAKIDQLMALCNHLDQQIDAATGKQSALLNAVMAQV